ncbi:RDD family protein [Nocardia yunnanensis]|uniref:RDD family protein n=1 Tax=Nocardia yunnanensis TaxID=2382165 RepID=A0A386Z719_9NOCA|nr:RDD family protein [Nocardia yunnanensis]AYF73396.1 RDD family protein [Nocardia yunnanensis]
MTYGNDPYSQQPQQPGGYGYPPGGGYAAYPPQPYAHWGARVAALLIDSLIVGVPAAIFYGIGFAIGFKDTNCVSDSTDSSYSTSCSGGLSAGGLVLILIGALIALVGRLYFIYMEGKTGQTPGKKMLNIKLIREADGQVLGFGMAFVRQICHVLDSLACYLGWLWPLWDAKRQTFADKIINSIVVKV